MKSMKCDFKMLVLIVEWSSFWGGLKEGFYCISFETITPYFDNNYRFILHISITVFFTTLYRYD